MELCNKKGQMHLGASSVCALEENPSVATFRVVSEQQGAKDSSVNSKEPRTLRWTWVKGLISFYLDS